MNTVKLQLAAGLTLLLLFSVSVHGLSADDYVKEFNNLGETCIVENYFNYWTPNPTFFDSNNYKLTVPVIYQCCDGNNKCTSITFDLQNQQFLPEGYVAEIIDIDYIHENIENGTLKTSSVVTTNSKMSS